MRGERLNDHRQELLLTAIFHQLQPFVDEPARLFRAGLDGQRIFEQAHDAGRLPQEIREEGLEQFYAVLFPQIAQLVAGSPLVLQTWQAEGYREGFRQLNQLADEVSAVTAKIAGVPGAVVNAFASERELKADSLAREFNQVLLSQVLLKVDLSPLQADRPLQGTLREHFVIPAIRTGGDDPTTLETDQGILSCLTSLGCRTIVDGGAGVGKTTFATWLQSTLLQSSRERLVILLRLRGVRDIEQRTVLSILQDQAGIHQRDRLTDETLRRWYETGQLVLILDGFDEVPEGRRDAVQAWILSLTAAAKQAPVIVTTRPLQSGHFGPTMPGGWQRFDLLAFDHARVVDFITRWHQHLPEGELSPAERAVDAEKLAKTFDVDPSLRPLANTPLMLGTLLFVHHRDKELPSGRCDLYRRYISAMLGIRDTGLGIEARATRLDYSEKRKVLGRIALHFHIEGVSQVGDATMRQIVSNALQQFGFDEDVDHLMAALCERTGLLQGPGTWSFTHKTIGEFLMAELVHDGTGTGSDGNRIDRMTLWHCRHDDSWLSVLFFWAGLTSERELEEFVRQLIDEREPEANWLALSLLTDQGDRLILRTQRELALCVLAQVTRTDSGDSILSGPCVPRPFCPRVECHYVRLRGMNNLTARHALTGILRRGVLKVADVRALSPEAKKLLTMGLLHLSLDETPDDILEVMSPDVLAFKHFPRNSAELAKWLAAYPHASDHLLLMTMGRLCAISKMDHRLLLVSSAREWGEVLWNYRTAAVDPAWLRESTDSIDYNVDQNSGIDVLQRLRSLLQSLSPSVWNLTDQQHQDLLDLCDRLEDQRNDLNATADPPSPLTADASP